MNSCKKMLAIVLCLIVGSVINTGPKAVKNTFKAYAAFYAGYFFSGTIYATKMGREIQKDFLEIAEVYNNPQIKKMVTAYGRTNPIYQANIMTSQYIARTIPRTLPPFIWSSVFYHAYKNKDLNF